MKNRFVWHDDRCAEDTVNSFGCGDSDQLAYDWRFNLGGDGSRVDITFKINNRLGSLVTISRAKFQAKGSSWNDPWPGSHHLCGTTKFSLSSGPWFGFFQHGPFGAFLNIRHTSYKSSRRADYRPVWEIAAPSSNSSSCWLFLISRPKESRQIPCDSMHR